MEHKSRHQCLVYKGSPLQQLPALAAVIHQKLQENYRCLYLNNPMMVSCMSSSLEAQGVGVESEIAKNRLLMSSEPAVSAHGVFEVDVMIDNLGAAVDKAHADGFKGLFATGDMTWEFGPQENFTKLLQYEWKLEKLFHEKPQLCGICQYHYDTLPLEAMRQGLVSHQTIFVNETLSRVNQYYSETAPLAEQASKNTELDRVITVVCQPREE